jgi:hypothetical protein
VVANPKSGKYLFKLVFLVDVVIYLQHRHCQRFTETTGAHQKEILIGVLYFADKPCLVHVITIVPPEHLKTLNAIWYAPCFWIPTTHNENFFANIIQSFLSAKSFLTR